MRVQRGVPMRAGLGQTYQTVSTAAGDYQVVTAADGTVTTFDPNGNVVSGVAVGPLQAGQSALAFSAAVNPSGSSAAPSIASLFPGITGSTNVAGVSVPSWLIPAALIVGAFVLFKGFSK